MGKDDYCLLQVIYKIVQHDPKPQFCPVRPRELILHCMEDWSSIKAQLDFLEREEMVTTRQAETLIIHMTEKGKEYAQQLVKEERTGKS